MPHILLSQNTVKYTSIIIGVSGSCTTTKLSSCIIGGHQPILPQVTAAEHGLSLDRLNRKTGKHTTSLLVLLNMVVTLPQGVSTVRKNSAGISNPHSATQSLIKTV